MKKKINKCENKRKELTLRKGVSNMRNEINALYEVIKLQFLTLSSI